MSINDYPAKLTGTAYYYVRTAWEDEETQLGQYRTLKSAIAKADANPGSFVFSGDGISIYPEDEETVTVSEGTEEISLGAPEPTQDEPEGAENTEDKEVVAAEEEAVKTDSDASEEGGTSVDGTAEYETAMEEVVDTENADAMTEAVEDAYPNDGNTETILYGKATTLVNIRDGNSLDADKITVIRKGILVEILEECDNGWYRIKCDAAECGYGFISARFLSVGSSLYTVQPADSLWKIAEKTLNSGAKYTEIKTLNGLTSNVIKVGMLSLLVFCGNCDILCALHSDCAPSGECGLGSSFYHTSKITMDFLYYAINRKNICRTLSINSVWQGIVFILKPSFHKGGLIYVQYQCNRPLLAWARIWSHPCACGLR